MGVCSKAAFHASQQHFRYGTSTYKQRRTAPLHLSVYLAPLSLCTYSLKNFFGIPKLNRMHSATALGPNSVNAGLHLVTLRSNQACPTKESPKGSVDVSPSMEYSKSISKRERQTPKKSMAAVLTLLFDHFHASMTKYSHLLAAITLFLSDCLYSFIVLKCNCFSLAQRLLGQCCRVHVALQSRDKIQDLRRRPSCKEGMDHSNVSNQRNAQLGWQMLKFRVGIHVRCSVSQTT